MVTEVMDEAVNKRDKVIKLDKAVRSMAPESERRKEKVKRKREEKHASSPKENLAEAVVSEVTDGAVNKPDEVIRTVASGRERKEEKVKRQSKEKRGPISLKEKLAEAVVSEVADKAVSVFCVSKVIDSLAKIG